MTKTPVLNTFLWFPGNMAEALEFYKAELGAVVHTENRNGDQLFTATFTIGGHELLGMNFPGGPAFNDAISLSLSVEPAIRSEANQALMKMKKMVISEFVNPETLG